MESKTVYRLAPCPDFDVTGTEQWLEDMARQGLTLSDEGFWGSLAVFQRTVPRHIRYRLEASAEGTGMWGKHDGYPAPEARELHKALGWEFLANRGEFHIYCTEDPEAPEPDTDPLVRSMALDKVKKRLKSSCISLLLWTLIYPLIAVRGALLLTAVELGTWFFLIGLLLVLWGLVDAVCRVVLLKRMQRQLRETGQLEKTVGSRRSMILYYVKRILKPLLILLWLLYLLLYPGGEEDRRIPLDQYQGQLPFATIRDFAGEGARDYQATLTGMGFNTLLERQDLLAPRCIDYHENAQITMADGSLLSGGLMVDYYETRSPQIAQILARELHRHDRWEKDYAPIDIEGLDLDADWACAYKTVAHFPTVVLQKGNVVVRAQFYQLGESQLSLDEWAGILAESLG